MPVERTSGGTSLIDVLDRVLDKGMIDAASHLALLAENESLRARLAGAVEPAVVPVRRRARLRVPRSRT